MSASQPASENPYVAQYHAARREWNERYGDLITAKRNWRRVRGILSPFMTYQRP